MQYPLDNFPYLERSYKFGVPTFYSDFHLGEDIIVPTGTPIYAWQDLEIVDSYALPQGGNTMLIKTPNNPRLFRFLHLKMLPKRGKYKEGRIIAYTGNTGLSTAPHLHHDISKNGKLNINDKNNFEDPYRYFISIMANQPKPKSNSLISHNMIIKEKGKPALYVLVGNVLIPIATPFETYLKDFTKEQIVEVDSAQMKKFKISKDLVVKPA